MNPLLCLSFISTSPFLPWMSAKGLTALIPEMDYNRHKMGLLRVMSVLAITFTDTIFKASTIRINKLINFHTHTNYLAPYQISDKHTEMVHILSYIDNNII
jgi:hypothetical protein